MRLIHGIELEETGRWSGPGCVPTLERGTIKLDRLVAASRGRLPDDTRLLLGNHDRAAKAAIGRWDIDVLLQPLEEGPFCFAHHPEDHPGRLTWAGHLHPGIRQGTRKESLRLPCFHITPTRAVVPAFSYFTGLSFLEPAPGDQCYFIVDHQIRQVEGRRHRWCVS